MGTTRYLVSGVVLALALWSCEERVSDDAFDIVDEMDLTPPERIDKRPPTREELLPPVVPEGLELARMSGRLALRLEAGELVRKETRLVTRSEHAAHFEVVGMSQEWTFERNPVDPNRTSASFVDHATRTILQFHDSELRAEGLARGWLDVLTLGISLESVERMRETEDTVTITGRSFRQRVIKEDTSGSRQHPTEIWWDAASYLPHKVVWTIPGIESTLVLDELRYEADEERLRPPSERFPDYRVMDMVDWHEEHGPDKPEVVLNLPWSLS